MTVGAPPKGRDGTPAMVNGSVLVAGVAPIPSFLSSRASSEDIWAPLSACITTHGQRHLGDQCPPAKASRPDNAAVQRFAAYVEQARTLYDASLNMGVRSRPLVAYYSVLNLAKAWLTVVDPAITAGRLRHGAADRYAPGGRYTAGKEKLLVQAAGLFRQVAERTGGGWYYAADTEVQLLDLLPYLCEAHDEQRALGHDKARLAELVDLDVKQGTVDDNGTKKGALWLVMSVGQDELRRRNVSVKRFLDRAPPCAQKFHVVSSPGKGGMYESDPVIYGRNTEHGFSGLSELFEESAFFLDRTVPGGRYFTVIDERRPWSQEAATFLVLHHLSNIVRYRPAELDKLVAGKLSWVLGAWVPRALENAVLGYSSRILGRDFRVG